MKQTEKEIRQNYTNNREAKKTLIKDTEDQPVERVPHTSFATQITHSAHLA